MQEMIIALALITHTNVEEVELHPVNTAVMREVIQEISLQNELISTAEVYEWHELALAQELFNVSWRYHRSVSAPHLAELNRFSTLELLNEQIEFNRTFADILMSQLNSAHAAGNFDAHAYIKGTILENDNIHYTYLMLQNVYDPRICTAEKRIRLDQFRELVGYNAFYSGMLPACVPLERIPIER